MRIAANSRKEYFDAAGERSGALKRLDALIRKAAPTLKPFFLDLPSTTMLGYGKFHYKYGSGREGEWAVVGLAAQKNHLALYVCIARDGRYLSEIYGSKLGKVSCGKSCIRFKKLEDLDLDAVADICREAAELAKKTEHFQM